MVSVLHLRNLNDLNQTQVFNQVPKNLSIRLTKQAYDNIYDVDGLS